jgi:hypothetical protein
MDVLGREEKLLERLLGLLFRDVADASVQVSATQRIAIIAGKKYDRPTLNCSSVDASKI